MSIELIVLTVPLYLVTAAVVYAVLRLSGAKDKGTSDLVCMLTKQCVSDRSGRDGDDLRDVVRDLADSQIRASEMALSALGAAADINIEASRPVDDRPVKPTRVTRYPAADLGPSHGGIEFEAFGDSGVPIEED